MEAAFASTDLLNRIGRLESAAAQQERPWWRDAGHLISVVALAVSIALSGYTLWRDVLSDQDSARERLRETINDMAALDLAWAQLPLDTLSAEVIQAVDYSINNRRVLLLTSAKKDVETLDGEVPPEFPAIMGSSYVTLNDFAGALSAYEKLLAASPDNACVRAVALQNIGNVYLGMGAAHYAEGLERFAEAIELLKSQPSLQAQLARAEYAMQLSNALKIIGNFQ